MCQMLSFKKPDHTRDENILNMYQLKNVALKYTNMPLQSKPDTYSGPMYSLRLEKNQTQMERAPGLWVTFILQTLNVSELKSLPVLFLLTIQHPSDIILPKYINIIGSRCIWVNSPDICKTFQKFRKWPKDKNTRELQSQHQHPEPNDQLHQKHSQDDDMESQASTSEDYCGLRNQGATCYLNAVLQTLFMTEDFRRAVIELKEHNGQEKESVCHELKNIFECLKSNTENVTTHGMTKALNINNVHEQQDAAEYLQKILSEIDPETAKIFQGKKKYSTICLHSHHEHIEEINSFFSLTIDLDQYEDINVQKSFNSQFKELLMDGEDQLYCANCKAKTDMKMKYTIPELPDVLTLHLKRFYLDYNYMTYRKNNRSVKIPLRLSSQEECGVLQDYELYALINHTGSLSGGHYYADIKSFEDQQWYRFNDSMVHRIQNHYDVRFSENIVSETACLLFFRKSKSQQGKADVNLTCVASDESEGAQTNSSRFQIRINPEEFHQDCPSAVNDEHALLINTETEAKMDQTTEENCNESQTVPALFADRRTNQTRTIICIGLIILSLVFVCVLILILVLELPCVIFSPSSGVKVYDHPVNNSFCSSQF